MPDDLVSTLSIAVLPALLSLWGGYRLGIVTERRNLLRKAQLDFVPILKRTIADLGHGHPLGYWRGKKSDVQDAVWRLGMHLKFFRKRAFNKAWEQCESIKDEDLFPNNEPGFVSRGHTKDIIISQQKIIAPLSKLLKIAEGA